MRKVTYVAAVSLDGYIAGPGESLDWLRWSADAAELNAESWSGVDAMLMGRKNLRVRGEKRPRERWWSFKHPELHLLPNDGARP